MTNSDEKRDAERIIQEVLDLIREEYLLRLIDEPIEAAAARFEFDGSASITPEGFHRVMGDFVAHVYRHGLSVHRLMSRSPARAEALELMEQGYQNVYVRGYDAALLDALNPQHDGLGLVLGQLTQFIAAMARARHIRWVYGTRIDPLDWSLRCLIAEILLNDWGPFLPPGILSYAPSQLADHLPDLFNLLSSTDRMVNQMLRGVEFCDMKDQTQKAPLFHSEPEEGT